MKRLVDYNVTEDEIRKMFRRGRAQYEVLLDLLGSDGGDVEKFFIAKLLFIRGKPEESRKMIESIEKESYRTECRRDYSYWEKLETDDGDWGTDA